MTVSLLKNVVNLSPDTQITSKNKCSFCTKSLCCRYITQEIETPRSIRAFDLLLWQLSHQDVQLFTEGSDWYLIVNNPCQHLQEDGGCGIYEKRPFICRDHTNDNCEFDAPAEESFDLFFDGYESLDNYCRKRFKNWDRRFDKLK